MRERSCKVFLKQASCCCEAVRHPARAPGQRGSRNSVLLFCCRSVASRGILLATNVTVRNSHCIKSKYHRDVAIIFLGRGTLTPDTPVRRAFPRLVFTGCCARTFINGGWMRPCRTNHTTQPKFRLINIPSILAPLQGWH